MKQSRALNYVLIVIGLLGPVQPLANASLFTRWPCGKALGEILRIRRGGVLPTNPFHRAHGMPRSEAVEAQVRRENLAEIGANAGAFAFAGYRFDPEAASNDEQARILFERGVIGMLRHEDQIVRDPRNWVPTVAAAGRVGAAREMRQFYREILDVSAAKLKRDMNSAPSDQRLVLEKRLEEIERAVARYGRGTFARAIDDGENLPRLRYPP